MRRFSLPGATRLALLIAGVLALAAPAIATGGPSSPTVGPVLYDQYNNQGPALSDDITSQDFEDTLNSADAEAADDFVVPANTTWTIDAIDVDGEYQSRDAQTPVP